MTDIMDEAFATDTALDFSREAGGIQRFVCQWTQLTPPCHFLLHIIECLFIDNDFMSILDVVLCQLPPVLLPMLGDGVCNVLLL